MIRTSKHIISKNTNKGKLIYLDNLFIDYKHDLEVYINYIIEGVLPLKTNLSSKDLPSENIKHSRYKQLIYKQASEIIRSQLDKAKKRRFNNYKKLYTYYSLIKPDSKFTKLKFSELNLNNIIKTKYFTKPNLNNISINLDERFFNLKQGNFFNLFINIKLPYFNEKGTKALQINIPLNYHKHSNSFLENDFKLRKNIQIKYINNNYYISLIWEKEVEIKKVGKSIGIDVGYRKLIQTSDNQRIGDEMLLIYKNIVNKKRNGKEYKRALLERDNLINYYVNQINVEGISKIIIEDLNNVKYKSSYNNKTNDLISRWTYRPLQNKITMMCEVNGIELVKVSPAYTSQTCSLCGHVDKNSRQGDLFKCTRCGEELDADYNASINIHNRGVYSPSSQIS